MSNKGSVRGLSSRGLDLLVDRDIVIICLLQLRGRALACQSRIISPVKLKFLAGPIVHSIASCMYIVRQIW